MGMHFAAEELFSHSGLAQDQHGHVARSHLLNGADGPTQSCTAAHEARMGSPQSLGVHWGHQQEHPAQANHIAAAEAGFFHGASVDCGAIAAVQVSQAQVLSFPSDLHMATRDPPVLKGLGTEASTLSTQHQ
jgi:hypothetical protein